MPLTISRILHAGYLLEHGRTTIAFDPIFEDPFSVNCHSFPPVRFDLAKVRALELDAVFISHHHDDHCSLESLQLLRRDTPIYVYCPFEELRALIRDLGFTRVHALELDVSVHVGPFELIPRRALDADVDSMFHVRVDGLEILDVVDAWIDPTTLDALARRAPWDLILWPFQTLRELEVIAPTRAAPASSALPPEWIEQLRALRPRYVVPSSCQFQMEPWSWYNWAFFPVTYAQFAREVGAALPAAEVVRLDPGRSLRFVDRTLAPASPLSWIERVTDTLVDYAHDPDGVPPPTSEVARRFAPLSGEQAARVWAYCREGLLARYRALDPPDDPYFSRRRSWLLTVSDHAGEPTHFRYTIRGAEIALDPAPSGPPAWCTEIPLGKLYAALERGESLTSSYVRINAARFTADQERELAGADLLDDPLLRCLFTGVFGAYQRAQLERIRARDGRG